MATFSEDLYNTDFDEIPCEFCGDLFPFELVIEHQTGCRPDLAHFSYLSDDSFENLVKIAKEQIQETSSTPPQIIKREETNIVQNAPEEKTLTKQSATGTDQREQIKDILESEEPTLTFEDSVMQESGTKLMAYGSNVYQNKTEEEKPSFRAPSLPLLNNVDHLESEDACNSLSDSDDAGESLEDFWKRAEIKLSQRLMKTIQI